jgi:hypothetical protein
MPAIGVIKRVFGFAKVGYRGLKGNTHRLLVTCAGSRQLVSEVSAGKVSLQLPL